MSPGVRIDGLVPVPDAQQKPVGRFGRLLLAEFLQYAAVLGPPLREPLHVGEEAGVPGLLAPSRTSPREEVRPGPLLREAGLPPRPLGLHGLAAAGFDGVGGAGEQQPVSDQGPRSPRGLRRVTPENELGELGEMGRLARQELPCGVHLPFEGLEVRERAQRPGVQEGHVLRAHPLRLSPREGDLDLLGERCHPRRAGLVQDQASFAQACREGVGHGRTRAGMPARLIPVARQPGQAPRRAGNRAQDRHRRYAWADMRDATEDTRRPRRTSPLRQPPRQVTLLLMLALPLLAGGPALAACDSPPGPGVIWTGCDKRNAELTGLDLRGAVLLRTDLSGADLTGTRLSGADLTLTTLRGATLRDVKAGDARFVSADLSGAQLQGAVLDGASLDRAKLTGANLTGASLRGAGLYQAEAAGADLGDTQMPRANLLQARLRGARLTHANLEGANCKRVSLEEATLTGAVLRHANLEEAQLLSADLTGADLSDAVLVKADLSDARLEGAVLDRARWVDRRRCAAGSLGACR